MSINVLGTEKSVSLLDETAVTAFKDSPHSELIQTDDACQIHNSMIDKRPGLIARCVDVADVMAGKAISLLHMVPFHGPVRITFNNHESK